MIEALNQNALPLYGVFEILLMICALFEGSNNQVWVVWHWACSKEEKQIVGPKVTF